MHLFPAAIPLPAGGQGEALQRTALEAGLVREVAGVEAMLVVKVQGRGVAEAKRRHRKGDERPSRGGNMDLGKRSATNKCKESKKNEKSGKG